MINITIGSRNLPKIEFGLSKEKYKSYTSIPTSTKNIRLIPPTLTNKKLKRLRNRVESDFTPNPANHIAKRFTT